MKTLSAVCWIAALGMAAPAIWGGEPVALEKGFVSPPDSAKPWCYWWWLNGYVSRDGIVRDLDEMQKQGISGALVFHAGQGDTPKKIEFMSAEWRQFFRLAVEEAARRGITIGLNLCGGWNAGGSWVTPDDAAKNLVYGLKRLKGPRAFDDVLHLAASTDKTYHDIAVLAWPILNARDQHTPAKFAASSSFQTYGPELATDGDPATRWISNSNRPGSGPRADRPEYLQWTFDAEFPAAAIHIVPFPQCGPRDCQVQASADGKTFRTIARFEAKQEKPQTLTFDETTARWFRLVVTSSHPHRGQANWNVQIAEVSLLRKGEKPAGDHCRSKGMIDLTAKLDAAGRLKWDVPDGYWLVARFGWRVSPRAHTKCTGGESFLEIDPLSKGAMDRHFAATAGVVIEDVRPHVGRTFKYLHLDSGEIGEPDWTPTFRADFQRLRGYDPWPFLAAKAGQVVDDPVSSERFLEDYDRTIGDLMVECYYGRLGELAGKHGLGTHSEAAGYQKPTVDALRSMGCNDICMSEFWSRRIPKEGAPYIHQLAAAQLRYHDGIKNAASAAHTYGRKIVQAEAFTVTRGLNYDQCLFDLKDIGDRAFCAGLNRNMLCFYVCQAEEQSWPGYQWPGVGMEFDRHVTWWPMSGAWLTYLARCQHLLQAGRFVADVCYLQGEWAPSYVPARWAMDPPLPRGCDCDTINAETLIERATAGEDGSLTLCDGQRYRYLVLSQGGRWQRPPRAIFGPHSAGAKATTRSDAGSGKPLALSPATLKKLVQLAQAGVTIIGPRPQRAIGLGDPHRDAEIKELAGQLWGNADQNAGQRQVGKGRVIWGRSLAEVMRADNALPDLEIREDPETASLPPETFSSIPSPNTFDWIHRTIGDVEVYFIANLRNAAAAGEFTFRAACGNPELWNPVTGEIRALAKFRHENGRTIVPMTFAPRQSFFVVFWTAGSSKREAASGENFRELQTGVELSGPWEVSFDPKWGGPAHVTLDKLDDWSKRPEPAIRYYSGKATYTKIFDLPSLASRHSSLFLDLGVVKNIAAVRLNGRDLGVVWCAPWCVNVTDAIKAKNNELEIVVINLWPNRLIGDAAQPPEKRLTKTNVPGINSDMPLFPSGLLGPVTLRVVQRLQVK